MVQKDITWRAYRITNVKDLEEAFERYQLRMKKLPTHALMSDKCPIGIAEMIRSFLAKYGIEPNTSHYVMPYDLWLSNGNGEEKEEKEKIVQSSFL